MFKKVTLGITSITLAIGLSGCGDTELKDSEIKNLAICENTSTGVARYGVNIMQFVNGSRMNGIKAVVTKSDEDLKLTILADDEIVYKFKHIDEGELSKYNISCYEIQSLEVAGKQISRKDKTLSGMIKYKLFGMLLPTEQQIRKNKQERKLEDKQRQEAKAKRQKEIEAHQAEQKKQRLAKQQLIIDSIKNKLNEIQIAQEKLNKFLEIKKEFEQSSGIVKHIDNMPNKIQVWDSDEAKNVKLTDKILNDYLNLFDATKTIDSNIIKKRQNDIKTIKQYLTLDENKRTASHIHNLFSIYKRLNYTLNKSTRNITQGDYNMYKTELEKANECYRQIETQGYCG